MESFEFLLAVTDVVRVIVFMMYFPPDTPQIPSVFFGGRKSHLDTRGVLAELVLELQQRLGIFGQLAVLAPSFTGASWVISQ